MFESVTKRRKNPLINFFGWSLLTVVCVVFVFIGFSPSSQFLGQGGAAAEVNGEAISLRQYKEMLDRLDSNSQGNNSREARRATQENAINFLVSRSLIVQEAQKLNIHVSDQEVGQELLEIKPFYDESGAFSRVRYNTYLTQARMTEGEFESRIREDLVIKKMSQLIGYAAKDLDLVEELDKKIDQAQVNVAYVKLSPQTLKSAKPAMTPQDYLAKNEGKAQEYYKNHKTEYATPEQVRARHILVKFKDESPEAAEEALKKMKDIESQTTADNFSDMAQKHSDDPGSKTKGGDLGFFPHGRMVPEFEKAAFSTEPGKITEMVKTQFGYHLIIVDEKQEATEKSFDDVKLEIAKNLMAEDAFNTAMGDVKNKLREAKYGDLENYLSQNNLKWTNTGFFSITRENIPGVGQNKEFLDLAITLSPDNEYGNHLVYQGENAFLMKYKGAKMSPVPAANSQMDFFKQLMKQQRANAMVQTWTDSLRANAKVRVNPDLLR